MKRNMSNLDRIIRVLLAAAFTFLYINGTVTGVPGILLIVVSVVFLVTAITAFCPLYTLLKISTYKK